MTKGAMLARVKVCGFPIPFEIPTLRTIKYMLTHFSP